MFNVGDDAPTYQHMFNLALGLLAIVSNLFIALLWWLISTNNERTNHNATRIGEVQLLVVEEYLKKDEHLVYMGQIFKKLESIDGKISENAITASAIEERISFLIRHHENQRRSEL
jgi:hypothetical protein